MTSDKTSLGDRMKTYEAVTRQVLPRRTYTIIRLDGRAFHSYTRNCDKPFDFNLMGDMDKVAEALCKEMAGALFSYQQSDEISILLTDFSSEHTEPWFGGVVQKMISIAASLASVTLAEIRGDKPLFDARIFTIPTAPEVANYFIWRQRDCVRNSISMVGQFYFSHKRLQHLNGNQIQELLWQEHKVNWNNYPGQAKRGRMTERYRTEEEITYTDKRTQTENTIPAIRTQWRTGPAPTFTVSSLAAIPNLPALERKE